MKKVIQTILADPRYVKNMEYGEPRPGHPEGKVKNHILLNMIQFHDENFALWNQFDCSGAYDAGRFQKLLDTIRDWDLLLMFLIIDGSTAGKERSRLVWFMGEVRKHKDTRVDESWLS